MLVGRRLINQISEATVKLQPLTLCCSSSAWDSPPGNRLCNNREHTTEARNNSDESQRHYAQWLKSVSRGYSPVWFHLYDVLEWQDWVTGEQISGHLMRGKTTKEWPEEVFQGNGGVFYAFYAVAVTQICTNKITELCIPKGQFHYMITLKIK